MLVGALLKFHRLASYQRGRSLQTPDFVTPVSRIDSRGPSSVSNAALSFGNVGRSPMLNNWLPFLIYGALRVAIPASMIADVVRCSRRARRRARARAIMPFESGVSQGQPQPQRFTVSFYLTAMLFIVFDIEIVFLYPLAIQLTRSAGSGSSSSRSSSSILVLAYVYIWRKGALDWRVTSRSASPTTACSPSGVLWPGKGPGVFEEELGATSRRSSASRRSTRPCAGRRRSRCGPTRSGSRAARSR